jgi:hypothetical protein
VSLQAKEQLELVHSDLCKLVMLATHQENDSTSFYSFTMSPSTCVQSSTIADAIKHIHAAARNKCGCKLRVQLSTCHTVLTRGSNVTSLCHTPLAEQYCQEAQPDGGGYGSNPPQAERGCRPSPRET